MKNLVQYKVKDIEAKAWRLINSLYGSIIQIPVDIDYLIEKHPLVIDFDLVKGLKYEFGIAGTVFRLKEDCFAIYIDENIADKSPYFYRFTVAEELSHLILHKDLINKIDSIKKAAKLKADKRYKNMDRNAKRFAAAILMPNKHVINDSEILYKNLMSKGVIDKPEEMLREMITTLRKKYDVSKETMFYRLNEWPLQIIERVNFSIKNESDELLLTNDS